MTYLIETVVDGMWQWFAGRVHDGSRLSGGTLWSSTDDTAVRFTSRRKAQDEARRLGGTTYIRERSDMSAYAQQKIEIKLLRAQDREARRSQQS